MEVNAVSKIDGRDYRVVRNPGGSYNGEAWPRGVSRSEQPEKLTSFDELPTDIRQLISSGSDDLLQQRADREFNHGHIHTSHQEPIRTVFTPASLDEAGHRKP